MKFRRNTIQRAVMILTLTVSSGVPRTIPRVDNSLEGLTETPKGVTLTVMVYDREKI